eukprot:m.41611 g.41611  ORF g.41611 m.41611 type:complete len:273 (+) comp9787_c0_seq2:85-903(+)
MGCQGSKVAEKDPEQQNAGGETKVSLDINSDAKPAEAKPADGEQKAPPAMSFAVARNTHEAMRHAMKEMQEAIDKDDLSDFTTGWKDYCKNLEVHMTMEEKGMFPLLSKHNDKVGGLSEQHEKDEELVKNVDAALEANDKEACKKAFIAWEEHQQEHLKQEEGIMMPITKVVADSPVGRSKVFHDEVMPAFVDQGEKFEMHLKWVIGLLAKYGTQSQPPEVGVRVFVHGLQHACNKAQWEKYMPIAKEAATPEVWGKISEKFGLEDEGKIAE